MDPLIIDSAPKGSAILAYGQARTSRWNIKLLAFIVGSFALVALIAGSVWFFRATVTIPQHRVVTIAIQPRAVNTHLDTVLLHDLPSPWRAAIESRSRLPAILGVSLEQDGQFHAFAVVARTSTLASEPGLVAESNGLLRVLHDGATIPRVAVSIRNAFEPALHLYGHDGAFIASEDLLTRLAQPQFYTEKNDEVASSANTITGTWDKSVVHLNLTSDTVASETVSAPLFSILGDYQDQESLVIQSLLSQGVDLRGIAQAPYTLALDPANSGTLYLYWRNPLSSHDNTVLSSARGLKEQRLLELPDGTTHPEFQMTPSAIQTSTGPTSLYIGQYVASSTLLLPPQAPQDACDGTTVFSAQGSIFQSMLTHFGIPLSVNNYVSGFRLTDSKQGISLCFQ